MTDFPKICWGILLCLPSLPRGEEVTVGGTGSAGMTTSSDIQKYGLTDTSLDT